MFVREVGDQESTGSSLGAGLGGSSESHLFLLGVVSAVQLWEDSATKDLRSLRLQSILVPH